MHDSSKSVGHAEIVMDFVLSWCLRIAESKYKSVKPILWTYCRYMLGKLMDMEITDETNVESVIVKREWNYIDMIIEVLIDNNDTKEKHAILVENKLYDAIRYDSNTKENQLERYKRIFLEHYGKEWHKHYNFISCLDSNAEVMRKYGEDLKGTGYKAYSLDKMLNPKCWQKDIKKYTPTESDIFNEFWFRWGNEKY